MRDLANVKLIHFADLKRDLPGQIRSIPAFLDIDVAPNTMAAILLHCSFNYMKENASASVPLGDAFWEGGAKTFIYKGTNGRWREQLGRDVSERYLARAERELGHDCARWLAHGSLG